MQCSLSLKEQEYLTFIIISIIKSIEMIDLKYFNVDPFLELC